MSDLVVRRLATGLISDWLAFFDRDAFADNPDWSGCYCQWFHADHRLRPWDERTPEENREASIKSIGSGHLQGYLAYLVESGAEWPYRTGRAQSQALRETLAGEPRGDDAGERPGVRPVGWCQAAPRVLIPNIANDPELVVDDAGDVGSIVCFVVASTARHRGVATALLEAACAGFLERGLCIAEGYPARTATGDAANYHGPLALYLRTGFEPYRELEGRLIVRRELHPGDPPG